MVARSLGETIASVGKNRAETIADYGRMSVVATRDGNFRVSVALPTYEERDNIRRMVEALLEHVPDVHEIIVVDDGSPDGTPINWWG